MSKPELGTITRLRFITAADFPPFNFLDSNQRLSGYNIDLVRAVCTELSIQEKCEVQALPFGELQDALQARNGEAIVAGILPNAENRRQLLFSRSYFRFPARFAVNVAQPAEIASPDKPYDGKRVGVMRNSAHEKMLRTYFPKSKPVVYERIDWMLDDLKSGNTDAVFSDGMRLSFWIGSKASDKCCAFEGAPYYADDYFGSGLRIAISEDRPELVDALNFALRSLETKGFFAELNLRYFPVSFF